MKRCVPAGVLILLVVAHLTWLVERGGRSIPKDYLPGKRIATCVDTGNSIGRWGSPYVSIGFLRTRRPCRRPVESFGIVTGWMYHTKCGANLLQIVTGGNRS
jgi:hypothetical protein